MIGKNLAHYHIISLLGKGGMGEVYRARDTRLDREVALKVLPADVAANPDRLERFQREARIVAGLNHPHIVTLYDVEEADGVRFLVMELVEGQSLDDTLTSEGLPLPKVLEIGIAVADALSAAHEKGVVHRDLKPANVRITRDGHVKVLDFGLAKLTETAPVSEDALTQVAPITTEGTIMGTVPYMSPEQLRGLSVDHRSDIFSLGVLIYECAAGRRPFSGATKTDVISSILRDNPVPLEEAKPGLPEQLGRIVAACLQKEPEERYHAAKDVRSDLKNLRRDVESDRLPTPGSGVRTTTVHTKGRRRSWIGVALIVLSAIVPFAWMALNDRAPKETATDVAVVEKSIAVLPFVNMSADPTQDYFSDGISEELLNLLTKVSALRVAARTSSFSFKGRNVAVPEIAKQLNVEYVLEGSVRRDGERVRITAQLIQASDGFHVWSETYDRTFKDIFAIQDAIAADVVSQLQVTLLGAAPVSRKTDAEAYALYLQSVPLSRRTTPEGFQESDALLDRVLKIDSLYAPAWAAIGANYANKTAAGLLSPEEGYAKAREANLKSIALDPTYSNPHAGLAFIAMYGENDFAGAARHLQKAIELDPRNGRALGNSATMLNLLGRSDEAVAIWKTLTMRDPLNMNARFNLGTSQLYTGEYDDAIESFRTVLRMSPDNGVAHFQIGIALLMQGDGAGALAEFEQEKLRVFRFIGLPLAYHSLKQKDASDKALSDLIARHEKDAAGNIAGVYAFRGELDEAFRWLERERAIGSSFAEIVVDPLYRNLYDDPRWLPFLRSVGKAPEQLEKIEFKVAMPG